MKTLQMILATVGSQQTVQGRPVALRAMSAGPVVFVETSPASPLQTMAVIPSYAEFDGQYVDTLVTPDGLVMHLVVLH